MAARRLFLDRFLVGVKGLALPSAFSKGPFTLARRGYLLLFKRLVRLPDPG